jgi:hypothetical protein
MQGCLQHAELAVLCTPAKHGQKGAGSAHRQVQLEVAQHAEHQHGADSHQQQQRALIGRLPIADVPQRLPPHHPRDEQELAPQKQLNW